MDTFQGCLVDSLFKWRWKIAGGIQRGGQQGKIAFQQHAKRVYGFIEGLAWLNTVLENHFGIVDMPIIDAQNKSDIRSSMITEAVPVREELLDPKTPSPKKPNRTRKRLPAGKDPRSPDGMPSSPREDVQTPKRLAGRLQQQSQWQFGTNG